MIKYPIWLLLLYLSAEAQVSLIPFNKGGKFGYLGLDGTRRLPAAYEVSDQKWYAVNEAGEIVNLPYDEIDEFSRVGSFIRVRRGEQYFYMDSSGKEYIEK
ncbi:MAG: hypothetical protein NZM13_05675 [Cyclobacteriaceae bacterium]|nr:hypothetical protein [Cyclobacteriaceae bacterium]MDW8331130.1 hypothetical protein [Cyclobacteriaceae bacterium]